MRFPLLLRGAFLLLLGAVLLFPPDRDGRGDPAEIVRLPGEVFAASGLAPVFDSVLIGSVPGLVVRSAPTPPSVAELGALAAAASRAPLLVALPPNPRSIRLDAPAHPRAERAAAVAFRLLGSPGDTTELHLRDETGALDSTRVVIDSSGTAAGAFRIQPSRAGWHEWTIEGDGRRAVAGAWIADPAPLRVLVAAGPPSWESRFVVRALEETGVEVELIQPLGHGLELGDGRRALPSSPAALDEYDAVLVLDGADATPAQLGALREYASREGGGVLLVGTSGTAALGIGGVGTASEVGGDEIRWSLPPELVPLPAADVRIATLPLASLAPGVYGGATGSAGELFALRPLGRGRVASLGLLDTWRWRMQAGELTEHREFWRSIAEWLAGGIRGATRVRIEAPIGPVGHPVEVQLFAYGPQPDGNGGGDVPVVPDLVLTRPDGRTESLSPVPDPIQPGTFHFAFVPAAEGVHALAVNGRPVTGFHAVADLEAAPHAWARLALLAEGSGGGAVPADSLEAVVRRRTGESPAPSPQLPWAPIVFGVLVTLAAAEWAIRRLSGRR